MGYAGLVTELPLGLRAFIDDDVALLPTGLGDPERAALVAVLSERRDVVRLDRLASSHDKALAKVARKALHVLRTKGASPAPAVRVYNAQGPFAVEHVASLASVVDGRGERVVWFVDPSDAGYSVFEVELSETAGVLCVLALDLSRKVWRERAIQMRENPRALVGEVSGAHARTLIERAYLTMAPARRSPPDGYAAHHLRLQASAAELAAPHPVRALVAGVAGEATEAELAALLERPELALFVPSEDAIIALDRAIGEVVTGERARTAEQKLGQLEAAIGRVADEHVAGPLRARLAARLLELALLIASRQPDQAGLAAARACMVAADRLAEETVAPHAHPTVLAMFRRLIPAELMLKLTESS